MKPNFKVIDYKEIAERAAEISFKDGKEAALKEVGQKLEADFPAITRYMARDYISKLIKALKRGALPE
jgi:hypothetical protein